MPGSLVGVLMVAASLVDIRYDAVAFVKLLFAPGSSQCVLVRGRWNSLSHHLIIGLMIWLLRPSRTGVSCRSLHLHLSQSLLLMLLIWTEKDAKFDATDFIGEPIQVNILGLLSFAFGMATG